MRLPVNKENKACSLGGTIHWCKSTPMDGVLELTKFNSWYVKFLILIKSQLPN